VATIVPRNLRWNIRVARQRKLVRVRILPRLVKHFSPARVSAAAISVLVKKPPLNTIVQRDVKSAVRRAW